MQIENPFPKTAGNESTGFLKLVALITMCSDHVRKMLLPSVLEMQLVGRIAFPLYCWCLVVGFCYTRSVPKYLGRLLAVGLISQPLYMLALNHTLDEPNIFLTLALGLLAIWGIREKKYGFHIWGPLLCLILAVVLNANYGWKGVLFIMLLYMVRQSRAGIGAVMVAFCLYWGASSNTITSLFGIPVNLTWSLTAATLLSPWLRVQAMAILALPFMLWRCPVTFKMPKWLSYVAYPGHLVLLYLAELLLGKATL